jgi:NADP-dependent 3-hydroxy acid dehydrogenase YdfG
MRLPHVNYFGNNIFYNLLGSLGPYGFNAAILSSWIVRPETPIEKETHMTRLKGQIAWITGAGSGIGRAAAHALAAEGASLVLTGRRRAKLEETANNTGIVTLIQDGDVTNATRISEIAQEIKKTFGRLDIVVNNAGTNIPERKFSQLTPEGIDELIKTNLSSAFYCVTAALPLMRANRNGLFVHIGSRAGRFWDGPSGGGYIAAKSALIAMSHTINREECLNGIRSSIISPGETVTDILKNRTANPVTPEELERILKPEDCADLIRYVACLPAHICMSEVTFLPTWNRVYVTELERSRS